jgi:hypothetical protein
MYQFSIAIGANYYKLSEFNNINILLYIFVGQKTDIGLRLKLQCQGWVPVATTCHPSYFEG